MNARNVRYALDQHLLQDASAESGQAQPATATLRARPLPIPEGAYGRHRGVWLWGTWHCDADCPAHRPVMAKTSLIDFTTPAESTRDAAERAIAEGLTLGKYADPVEDGREGLTTDEAVAVAREDASLIYVVRAEVRS